MNHNEQRLLEELGRTETVQDVQAAYLKIFDAERKFAVRLKHARQSKEQFQAEVETFLDDLQDITGLKIDSPLFGKIAALTIARRLARRQMLANEFQSDLQGWPGDDEKAFDL
jgi:hypothetical protein